MDRNKELIRNTVILGAGTLIPKVFSLVILPILTTYLTTVEYGNFDLVNSIVSFVVPIITLQIQQAAFRYLVAAKTDLDKDRLVTTSIVYILGISVLCAPLVFFIFRICNLDWKVSLIICFLVLGESLYMLTGQMLRGIGQNIAYSVGIVSYSIVNLVTVVLFVYVLRLGLLGVILSNALSYVASAVIMLVRTLQKVHFQINAVSAPELKRMLKFSAPIVPSSISLWIVNLSDRLLVVHYLGAGINGIYSVATKVPNLYSMAYSIFNLAWTETAARVADDEDDPGKYYGELFGKMYRFLVGIMLIVIACTPAFYRILVNAQFYQAYPQTAVLYYGVFFNSFVAFYAGIYIALNRTKQVGISSAVGALLNLIINFLLIQKIGLFAASISTAVSYFVIMLYRAVDLKKIVNIQYDFQQIVIGFLTIVLSTILYYFNNTVLTVICFLIAIMYNLLFNRTFFAILLKKLHH